MLATPPFALDELAAVGWVGEQRIPSLGRAQARRLLRRSRRCCGVALGATLAIAALVALGAEDQAAIERRLADIAEDLNALDAWLDDAGRRLASLQRNIVAADRKIAAANAATRRLDARLAATQAALDRLAEQRAAYEQRRADQARRVARHAQEAWRHAGQDFLKLLLNQRNPDELERMARYHGYFSRARLNAIAAYRSTLEAISENERRSTTRGATLLAQREALMEQRATLARERREREALVSALSEDIGGRSDARQRLLADRGRIAALLGRLPRAATAPAPTQFASSKGRLRWPVAGRLAQRFGQPRAGGRLRWEGVYFTAPAGAEVQAIHRGQVVFADWLRGFGFLTIVDHGDGHMSLYGNADDLFKRAGDWVEPGEAIAAAGNSGGQPESGLYFEVRANGQPTNPLAWLERDQSR